jgi:hypothetical protein
MNSDGTKKVYIREQKSPQILQLRDNCYDILVSLFSVFLTHIIIHTLRQSNSIIFYKLFGDSRLSASHFIVESLCCQEIQSHMTLFESVHVLYFI